MSTRQKGHGKKRPRKFHRGRAEGRRALAPLTALEEAEARDVVNRRELRKVGDRYREDVELLEQVARSAPFVPALGTSV